MKASNWNNALKSAPDPKRAEHYYQLLMGDSASQALAQVPPEQASILCALFSGSQALSTWIATHPDLLQITDPEALKFPRRKEGLRKMSAEWFTPALAQKGLFICVATGSRAQAEGDGSHRRPRPGSTWSNLRIDS